jgi:hypothetical protein
MRAGCIFASCLESIVEGEAKEVIDEVVSPGERLECDSCGGKERRKLRSLAGEDF